jgi:RecA/RadA recombinase
LRVEAPGKKRVIERLSTGDPGLDQVLGGGLPVGSLIIVAGPPGSGKTILAQQMCFANATSERKAVYYTTWSEPHDKLVRHLSPFAFFDDGALGELLRQAGLDSRARVKAAAGLWKASDRNLGRIAENLLAFKAYTGGDFTAEQFAGAMTIAEWMSSTKGIFNLFLSLLKALSKRR